MTPPFLLDTSALFAHCLEEPGFEIVEEILERFRGDTYVSAMTWLEFQVRLEEIHPQAAARREMLACYSELLADPLPVSKEVVESALTIRSQCSQRLPNADAIIAATAQLEGATLVHRDPHLSGVPATLVRQLVLPERTKATRPRKP